MIIASNIQKLGRKDTKFLANTQHFVMKTKKNLHFANYTLQKKNKTIQQKMFSIAYN